MNFITDFDNGETTLVLAHGAGASMDSHFMNVIATGVSKSAIRVVRFEFPYMQTRRSTGNKRPPDRQSVLLACWREIIAQLGNPKKLIIGGKSMGGRMASLLAVELDVKGLVCLGYPFHPVGKPDRLRVDHLHRISVPTLILQGERDALGNKEQVAGYGLPPEFQLRWLPDGDHDFKPRVRSGYSHQHNLDLAISSMVDFIRLC